MSPTPSLSINELRCAEKIWRIFFPKELFHVQDSRLLTVCLFKNFFSEENGRPFISSIRYSDHILLDVYELSEALPFPDFVSTLVIQPIDLIGYIVRVYVLVALDYSPAS